MIPSLLISILVICIAFCIGYAIRRTGICAVAAARQSVLHRKHVRMRAFAITACWAGSFLLPLTWLVPGAHLSPAYPVTAMVLAGGALFGAGAWINGACAFGTLGHLGGGDTNYLGTLIGAFTGAVAASLVGAAQQPIYASPLSEPGILPVLVWLVFLGIALAANWRGAQRRRFPVKLRIRFPRVSAGAAFLVIGVGGAILYAVAEEWTYMSILSDRAARLVTDDGSGAGAAAISGALAALAGAAFAALRARRFRLKSLRLYPAGRKFLGGAMMGFAAALVPGGNDVMLVYGLPSAAGHAIAAYGAMTAVLFGLFAIKARLRPRPRPGRAAGGCR